jgi:hypothetical protein
MLEKKEDLKGSTSSIKEKRVFRGQKELRKTELKGKSLKVIELDIQFCYYHF